MESTHDPEFQLLASISASLSDKYTDEDASWRGSPFAWILQTSSRQRGKIGEELVAAWLESKGFDVQRSPDAQADRVVNGHRVEVKLSTLWKSGVYKFQQLRDQNYEYAICLGVSPFQIHCWTLPKSEILDRWRRGDGIRSQHSGAGGTDTAWLSFYAAAAPGWLSHFGGSLQDAVTVLDRFLS